LGALLPPTTDKYLAAQKEGVNLQALLDKEKEPTGEELFKLGKLRITGAEIDQKKALANGIDFDKISERGDTALTPDKYEVIKNQNVVTVGYPEFAGFTIRTLFDFFMVFVVLCGAAAIVLYALTPLLKRMMHGVR
jgi:POT family proton-dependent oligopeptide transporter